MADFLSNGVSALIAFQRALDVTSQNISNVATEGYSRQSVDFVTNPPQKYGNGYVGSGVNVESINRTYDNFLAQQVRTSSSSYQRSDTFATLAARIDNMFGDTTTGVSATLQKFVTAVQQVADAPSSTAPRQVLLSTAQAAAWQMQQYDSQLANIDSEIESRLKTEVSDINTLAQGIARLNAQIKDASAAGQMPNDLMDQRDKLLDQLSTHVNVSTSPGNGNVVNVSIGNGQPLVLEGQANTLVTRQDPFDPTRSYVAIQTATVSTAINVSSSLSGGTLGGLLDLRTQVLDPARNTLGRISVGIAQVVNDQQKAGIDLNGMQGANMFAVGGVQNLPNTTNTGNATLSITRSNTSALTDSDYILEQTAGGWTLRNASTGAAVALSGTGTAADPLTADGISIVVGGTANNGDQFLIRPTRGATAGLTVRITDPAQIAAASPVRVAASTSNTGTGTIAAPTITNSADPALRSTVTIQFVTATTYTTDGGTTTQAYTPGAAIQLNGWSTSISGAPAAGDTFTVSDNAGGAGDNSNALLLAGAFDQKVLSRGTDSVNTALGRFVGSVGVATQQAQNSRDAQQSVYNDNVASRESVSGVNLDEEAANLLRYQQAYQAAAQLISVANTLFNSLLQATRG